MSCTWLLQTNNLPSHCLETIDYKILPEVMYNHLCNVLFAERLSKRNSGFVMY